MAFVEQLTNKLAALFFLKDSFTPAQTVCGEVFVTANQGVILAKSNPKCFVLLNASGKCQITFGGQYYQTKTETVDLSLVDLTKPVELTMVPKANYPYSEGLTIIRGQVQDSVTLKPIAGVMVSLEHHPEQAVSEENGSYALKIDSVIADENVKLHFVKTGFQSQAINVLIKYGKYNRLVVRLGLI